MDAVKRERDKWGGWGWVEHEEGVEGREGEERWVEGRGRMSECL